MSTTQKNRYWSVLGILGLALILRMAIVVLIVTTTVETPDGLSSRAINGDAAQYLMAARNMVEHGVFSLSESAPYVPDILRTPGYPVPLAGLYILAGMRHDLGLIVLIQALLGVLSTGLVCWIGQRAFSRQVGLIAAGLYAVAPAALIHVGIAITETLYGFLLLSGIALVLLSTRPGWKGWLAVLLAGLVFAWGTYTRPIGLYFIIIPALAVVFYGPRKRQAVMRALIMVAFYGLVLSPWLARNTRLFGESVFSSLANQNLLMYNVSSVEAQRLGISWDDAKAQFWGEYNTRLDTLGLTDPNQAQVSDVMGQMAFEYILAHPVESALYQTVDMINVLRPGYSMAILLLRDDNALEFGVQVQQGNLGTITNSAPLELAIFGLMTIYYGLLYGLLAIGGLVLLGRREWQALFLLGGSAFYHLYLPGSAGNSRFRAPLEGVLAVVAAIGAAALWNWIEKKRNERSAARLTPENRTQSG